MPRVQNRPKTRTAGAIAGATLTALAFAGCAAPLAAPEHRRPPAADAGRQGASWEAVFPTPEVAAATRATPDAGRFELARRDDAMNVRDYGPITAADRWPEPVRPSVFRPRRVFISDRPGTHTFFREEHRRFHYRYSTPTYPRYGY